MKRIHYLLFLLLFSFSVFPPAQAEELPPMPEGPIFLTSTIPEMLTPDFWIDRLPEPDRALKTPEELNQFNRDIQASAPGRYNIFHLSDPFDGKAIQEQLRREYETVSGRKLFDVNDQVVEKQFFEARVKPVMQIDQVPKKISLRWGVATQAMSVRALPTETKLLEEIGDVEFDQLQFTLIKLWTPVAIFHTSRDGEWHYLQAPYAQGWVRAEDIAVYPSKRALIEQGKEERFLAVTGESVPVYLNPDGTEEYLRPSMGTTLPLVGQEGEAYVVSVPLRRADGSVVLRNAFVLRSSDVHIGYPAFTQRNIIRQAFKLLGARYGWGGMYNGRDCSGFTHDVFLSMGVDMPRDSKNQIWAGTQLGHFEAFGDREGKLAALAAATPGLTLLRMPLHLMLYLGEVNGEHYIIHSTWAERISMTSDERIRINQVIVSDLTLNGNSYLGSLFDRTISMSEAL